MKAQLKLTEFFEKAQFNTSSVPADVIEQQHEIIRQCALMKEQQRLQDEWMKRHLEKYPQDGIKVDQDLCSPSPEPSPAPSPTNAYMTPTRAPEVPQPARVTNSQQFTKSLLEIDQETREQLRNATKGYANSANRILFGQDFDSNATNVMRNAMQAENGEPNRADILRFKKKREENMVDKKEFEAERKMLRKNDYSPYGSTPTRKERTTQMNFRMYNNRLDQNILPYSVQPVNGREMVSSVLNNDRSAFNQLAHADPVVHRQPREKKKSDAFNDALKKEIRRRLRPDVNANGNDKTQLIKLYSILNGSVPRTAENEVVHDNIESIKNEESADCSDPETTVTMMLQFL